MQTFIELSTQKLSIAPTQKIIKHKDYLTYLDAKAITDCAEREAEEILQNAKRERQAVLEDAYQEGLNLAQEKQSNLMLDTLRLCQQYISNKHEDLTEIAIATIRKVLGELDQQIMLEHLIKQALSSQNNAESITLKLAPACADHIQHRIKEILSNNPGIHAIEIVKDERIGDDRCVLETPIGTVEASLQSQLDAIEKSIRQGQE
ncbi:Yop proteins translocation protein L [Thalassocella blandensis]|nr:Yop proteins translocation protein L [Thalassocella blandensis]